MSGAFSVILLINLDNCVTTHRKMKKILALFVLTISMLGAKNACAQNRTMFEYPIAPDTCTTLESRCNYSTAHFWDNFEFHKPLTAESDSILMSTFIDFFQIMSSANRNVGQSAVRLLMNKAQVNHPNFLRLMGAAEYLLYYTPQPLIDDVYLAFAQSAVEASWVEKKVKSNYAEQIRTINNTKLGSDIYNFSVTDANGEKKKIHDLPLDSAEIVLLFFTNDEIESSLARTRIETDLGINELVNQGYTKLMNVYVGKEPKSFLAEASKYPNWTLLATTELKNLDVRVLPSFVVLDNAFRVMNKNQYVDDIKRAFNP